MSTKTDDNIVKEGWMQCQFCDALFPDGYRGRGFATYQEIARAEEVLDDHVREVHKKVKVKRGHNTKWVDLPLAKELIRKGSSS